MSNVNISSAKVLWPSREWAIAFVSQDKVPFINATIGVTYPLADYSVRRDATTSVTVFEYVLDGEGELFLDGRWCGVRAGDCYILKAGEPHHYRADRHNPMTKIWINYVADYIRPMLDAYGIDSGIYRVKSLIHNFERLKEYAESNTATPNVNFSIAECVHDIIRTIAQNVRKSESDEYRIREALSARVYDKLNLDELASSLHISKSQIIRTFKRTYSSTPYEYFLGLKMDAAKILLRDTKMQIKEISEKLSICDEHYFSSLFRSRVGVSPREYRAGLNTNAK